MPEAVNFYSENTVLNQKIEESASLAYILLPLMQNRGNTDQEQTPGLNAFLLRNFLLLQNQLRKNQMFLQNMEEIINRKLIN